MFINSKMNRCDTITTEYQSNKNDLQFPAWTNVTNNTEQREQDTKIQEENMSPSI